MEQVPETELARLLAENKRLREDMEYFKACLSKDKRPYSDKFSGEVIAGQVKEINRLSDRLSEALMLIAEVRDFLERHFGCSPDAAPVDGLALTERLTRFLAQR